MCIHSIPLYMVDFKKSHIMHKFYFFGELADILNAYTKIVQADPGLTGLRAYSAAI